MFNWFQRLLPRTGDFFGMFEAHAATIVGAAGAMTKLVNGGTPQKQHIAEVDRQEHTADDIIRQGLHEYLMDFLERISALGDEISRRFLVPAD